MHTNELQVNVYPNHSQVTLFGKGNSPKLSISNANFKENSGMFGRIFFKNSDATFDRKCRHVETLKLGINATDEGIIKEIFIIQQFNSQH